MHDGIENAEAKKAEERTYGVIGLKINWLELDC
jgi:hypothetical protein